MGVSGYGTASQYLYYRDLGRAYQADLVLLSFYPGNDVRNNSPTQEPTLRPEYAADGAVLRVNGGGSGGDKSRGLLASSAAYTYFRKLIVTRQPGLAERLAGAGLLDRAAVRPLPMVDGVPVDYWVYAADAPSEWNDAWAHTEHLLTALRDAVVADHAKFVVMIVTSREQIYPADWAKLLETYPAMQQVRWDVNGPERHVLNWCEHAGVTCVQLSPAFRAAAGAQRLHYNFDGHWTAAGHALAAQTVANFLRGADWPPAQYAEGK
jgi:hypothetical protein